MKVKRECRRGSHLPPRRCSRERNLIGCDGVEDNKPSPKNRECAFTEISTRGDFYAFSRCTSFSRPPEAVLRNSCTRPISSVDFCRSPSFADPPRWADKKIDRRTSAPIGFKSACFLLCEYLVLFCRNGCGIVRAVPFGCCVVILQQHVHSCVLPALE